MRTTPMDEAVIRFGAILARRLWVALTLTLVVTIGAIFVYARPSASWRHAYIATQAARIVTGIGSASSSYDAYLANQKADGLAHEMASGAVFTSAAFDDAVATTLMAQHVSLVSRFGMDVPGSVSAGDIAAAFSATNSGDMVTLSCRWSNAAGANALLSTTISVLDGADDLRTLMPSAAAQAPDVAQAAPIGTFSAAHLDPSAAGAARQELLARIALGALFGLAVVVLLASLTLRSTTAHTTEIASRSDTCDA